MIIASVIQISTGLSNLVFVSFKDSTIECWENEKASRGKNLISGIFRYAQVEILFSGSFNKNNYLISNANMNQLLKVYFCEL